MEPQGNQPNRRGRPAGSGTGSWKRKIKWSKPKVLEVMRKAEEELDKLMANHTLHFKPEKQEEFLAKRGRKRPNKEEERRKFEQVKEQETESEAESWGGWGPAQSSGGWWHGWDYTTKWWEEQYRSLAKGSQPKWSWGEQQEYG